MSNDDLYDAAREVLAIASAAAGERRRKAAESGDAEAAASAAYEAGRIDSEREHLDHTKPDQLRESMNRWGLTQPPS